VKLAATMVAVDAGPAGRSPAPLKHDGIRQLPSRRGPSETAWMEAKGPEAARQPLHSRRVVGSLPRTQLQGDRATLELDAAPSAQAPLISDPATPPSPRRCQGIERDTAPPVGTTRGWCSRNILQPLRTTSYLPERSTSCTSSAGVLEGSWPRSPSIWCPFSNARC
jgi:hypothetical protein